MNISDLCQLYEAINRDISDLKQTRNRIPENREYTEAIRKSITQEIEKFEILKGMILDLEIEIPEGHPLQKIASNSSETSSYFILP